MAKRKRPKKDQRKAVCFYCGKEVDERAWKCSHCGKWFSEGKVNVAAIAVVAVLAVVLIAYFISGLSQPSESVPVRYDLTLSAHKFSSITEAGRTASFALFVTNVGDDTDAFTFSTEGLRIDWQPRFELNQVSLVPGTTAVNVLKVQTDPDTPLGIYTFFVQTTSTSDPSAVKSIELIVKISQLGSETATVGDKVQVDYFLWLKDGRLEDSSEQHGGPLKIYVGPSDPDPNDEYTQVIEGFWEGVDGLKIGETTVVWLPPNKGYTDPSHPLYGKILIFEITLVSIDR